ncbi:hypothetical protein CHARACLAT_010091 [Characodon lateralis]|uniref:Uncharacterized protein n=1 Tax=Characodon lateralis TaxID=208331 RepID=A0ABU7DHE5_9TELE|nr:hypothetical protein [Characodon lateralis]
MSRLTCTEVLPATFTRQTVRRVHGLRSAAHSTLFTQTATALSPQCSLREFVAAVVRFEVPAVSRWDES